MVTQPTCLIVGAGLAGLTAAEVLQSEGWKVTLLDKSRGPGGRMATRRIGESRFDHGAQFFTVRDPQFHKAITHWKKAGFVAPWFTESDHVRYWARGGMNALAKQLANSFDVRAGVKVERVEPFEDGWRALAESGETFSAHALLLTPPAPQTLALLHACVDRLPLELITALAQVEFDPCFALLVLMEGANLVPAPGYVRPESGPMEWIADNTQKGVSKGSAALTIHARADFSRLHLEDNQADLVRLLLDAAKPWCGGAILAWQLHRWRYSKPIEDARPNHLFHQEPAPFAIAGDAFGGGRLEGAFLSGLAAAERIAHHRSLNLNERFLRGT